MKILVVEDSDRLRRSMAVGFKQMGIIADFAEDGAVGLVYAQNGEYDVIVLDIMLPKLDGISLLKQLRKEGVQTHVLILSAKRQVSERIEGLEVGADDYLTKPFSFDELCTRIKVLGRRSNQQKSAILMFGALIIDTASATVHCTRELISLTTTEYQILECLALRKGRVVSKDALLNWVSNLDKQLQSNSIEVHISSLRKKIAAVCPSAKSLIMTKRGFGYLIP